MARTERANRPCLAAFAESRLVLMKGPFRGYLVAALAGAAVGGAGVAVATEALPRLTRRTVGVMAEEMKRRGLSPDT